jgi:hypothetical protein
MLLTTFKILLLIQVILKYKKVLTQFDMFCNVMLTELLNWTMIKRNSKHRFGGQREWISSVIGKNLLAGTLTRFGRWINDRLDDYEYGHTIKQIAK